MDLFLTFLLILGLELVLGIDNILVISILVSRLEPHERDKARVIGLAVALCARVLLLFLVVALTSLQTPILYGLSIREFVLLLGGMFLLWKAVKEIHHTVELVEDPSSSAHPRKRFSSGSVIKDIVLLDVVFSLDSVITAVGLTNHLYVIVAAVVVSFGALLFFAKPIGDYLLARPSLKILALSFLVTIGITLFLEGLHREIPKAYIYLPMGFALAVELLQMRFESNKRKKAR